MKDTDKQCLNSAEASAVPASTSTPRFFLQGILILASVPLFGLVVRLPQAAHLDRSTLDVLIAMRIPILTQVILVVTNVFAPVVMVSWTIILGNMIRVFSGSWREGLIISAVMMRSSAITALVKKFIESIRPAFLRRPVVGDSYSFPSGYTAAVAAVYAAGTLLMFHHLANRIPNDEDGSFSRLPIRIIRGFVIAGTVVLVALIALVHLYLGAHWSSGVIAGVLVGTASLLIVTELLLGST